MEGNFRMLGLTRSASQEDVRKAYKTKALALHPDRNPNGGDMFKKVNEAYEACMKHIKAGRPDGDFIHLSPSTGAGSRHASRYRSSQGPAASTARPSSPLFSEAELFGNINTDFGDFGRTRHRSGTTGGGTGKSAFGFDSDEFIRRDREAAANAARNRSTGGGGARDHVNIPAYQPPEAFERQQQHFYDMERKKADLRKGATGEKGGSSFEPSSNSRRGSRETPGPTPPPRGVFEHETDPLANTAPVGATSPDRPSSRSKATASSSGPSSQQASPEKAFPLPRKAKSMYSNMPTRTQLAEEWEQTREQMRQQEQITKTRREMEASSRKAALEAETKAEWQRLQSEMEEERHKIKVDKAMLEAEERLRDDRKADEALRDLARQRRETKRQQFSHMLPSDSAMKKMSDMEVYTLMDVLKEGLAKAEKEAARRRFDPCVVCSTTRRTLTSSATDKDGVDWSPSRGAPCFYFMCDHQVTCGPCARTSVVGCPICGSPLR